MRRTPSPQMIARLTPGAGAKTPPADTSPDTSPPDPAPKAPKRPAQGRSGGRAAVDQGRIAEEYAETLCENARLTWWRIPDPYRVVRQLSGGGLHVVPMPRRGAGATDYMAILHPTGRAVGFEVKSCDVSAPSWSYSELRESQTWALDAVARDGGLAVVILVVMEYGCVVRGVYVLPWIAGQGLPCAAERKSFPLADRGVAGRYRLGIGESWVSVALAMEDAGAGV